MNPLQTAATEARRRLLLELIAQSAGYSASGHLLYCALPEFGQGCAYHQVAADLVWLQSVGLITISEPAGVTIANLTAAGFDVAEDRAQVPGVARKAPRG